jgi:hypothetical protein
MNFNDLYNRLFISEAEKIPLEDSELDSELDGEVGVRSNVPIPDNYDVEPMPRTSVRDDTPELESYIGKLNEFLKILNGLEGKSLQKFVSDADMPNSILTGIAKETAREVTDLSEKVASLIQTLQSAVNRVSFRRRELTDNTTRY